MSSGIAHAPPCTNKTGSFGKPTSRKRPDSLHRSRKRLPRSTRQSQRNFLILHGFALSWRRTGWPTPRSEGVYDRQILAATRFDDGVRCIGIRKHRTLIVHEQSGASEESFRRVSGGKKPGANANAANARHGVVTSGGNIVSGVMAAAIGAERSPSELMSHETKEAGSTGLFKSLAHVMRIALWPNASA